MKMIGHQDSGEYLPVAEFRHRLLESAKRRLVRQNRFPTYNTNRNEINDRFLPAYQNRNAWRMAHNKRRWQAERLPYNFSFVPREPCRASPPLARLLRNRERSETHKKTAAARIARSTARCCEKLQCWLA